MIQDNYYQTHRVKDRCGRSLPNYVQEHPLLSSSVLFSTLTQAIPVIACQVHKLFAAP